MQKFVRVLLWLLFSCIFADANALPVRVDTCKPAQLKLNLFVLDAPGMSKLHSVYAISNVAATACSLSPQSINIWSGQQNHFKKIPVRAMSFDKLPGTYVLPANTKIHPHLPLKDIVWFVVSAAGDTAPTFNRLLWGLQPHLRSAKSVRYSMPYTHFPTRTWLHQGLAEWDMDKQCRYHGRLIKLTNHTNIDFSQIFYCG